MAFIKISSGFIGKTLPIEFTQTNNKFLIRLYFIFPILIFFTYVSYSSRYSNTSFTLENIFENKDLQILVLAAISPLYILYLRYKYSKQKETLIIDKKKVSLDIPYKGIYWENSLDSYECIKGNVTEFLSDRSTRSNSLSSTSVEYRLILQHESDSSFNIDIWFKALNNHMHLFGEDKVGKKAFIEMEKVGREFSLLFKKELRLQKVND